MKVSSLNSVVSLKITLDPEPRTSCRRNSSTVISGWIGLSTSSALDRVQMLERSVVPWTFRWSVRFFPAFRLTFILRSHSGIHFRRVLLATVGKTLRRVQNPSTLFDPSYRQWNPESTSANQMSAVKKRAQPFIVYTRGLIFQLNAG